MFSNCFWILFVLYLHSSAPVFALVFFTVFLAPSVLRISLGRTAKAALFVAAGVLLVYGLALTVRSDIPTPFALKSLVPNIGWAGVFTIAVVFDFVAAFLAFFVLRRMAVPTGGERPSVADLPVTAPAPAD